MRRVLGLALCLWLAGCGLTSAIIKTDSLAFNDIIEDTTNKLLVLNVLRARDKAPLHFADIPVIRESMQQSASLSFLHVNPPIQGTTQRSTRTTGLGMQFTPSFELTHLHSKEFHTGIATPIDSKFVKYWLDRGLDRRIVLLLFFSSAEIVETRSEKGPINKIRIMNSPREALEIIRNRKPASDDAEVLRCDTQSDFERYLKLLNTLRTFFAHTYRERRLLASGVNLDLAKDPRNLQPFAALDQNKVQLVFDKGRSSYNVYALSPDSKVAFCLADDSGSTTRRDIDFEFISAGQPGQASSQSCFRPVVDVPAEDSTRVELPERPISFAGPSVVKAPTRYCEIYNRFTRIETPKKDSEYPKLELRLHIRSVGEIFQFLGDLVYYQDEIKKHLARNAHANLKLNTPVTFGYLHQLVGLHRSGADIRQTPTVQVLP